MRQPPGSEVRVLESYSAENLPLAQYALIGGLYGTALLGLFLAALRAERSLPPRIEPFDVFLLGFATHKTSRLISKDRFNAPLRAPFAQYCGEAGAARSTKSPAGTGLRRALGRFITRP